MKFTEGYWLRSQRAEAVFAAEGYEVKKIPGGMRILAPTIPIRGRGDTLNLPTITLEFTAPQENIIAVRAFHYGGYRKGEPVCEKYVNPQPVEVNVTEAEAVMRAGRMCVRVDRKNFSLRFEYDGRLLTQSGFRNLGYVMWDKEPSTMFPAPNYLTENGTPYMFCELGLQAGENVYGLGEHFTSFVKNGQVVEMWNEDGGTASQVAYKNVPFYMTNKGYGVYVDHTDDVSFEVASEKVEFVGFSVPGEELRFCVIGGEDNAAVMKAYTAYTGRPALPPAWSFGLWLSTSFTTDYSEKTTSAFVEGMAERQIPLSVFHFDCFWMKGFHWCDFTWDDETFPDVEGMLARYHEKGLKVCCWINSYIAQESSLFEEASEKGYLVQRADGRGTWQTDNWQAGMGLVDFTNPEACKWYQEKLRTLLRQGVDCFKTDFGERVPVNVKWFDGSDPAGMHNYYTYLYNKCVFDLLKEEKGEKEAVVFARSAAAGSQQFPVHWGGDCSANYPSMAETLRGGLSFAMSGFSFWSHDISGFEQTASPDLYKRWAAFGLLSTHSRLHGSQSYRVPWVFDDEASLVVKHFSELKNSMMPYLYAMAVKSHDTGLPMMRPLVFDYPKDPAAKWVDTQYMLGDSLLVAPVFDESGYVEYYLPEGRWTHLLSGEVREGGRYYREQYDYFSLPLFVKENTLFAMGTICDRPAYDYRANAVLRLIAPAEGVPAVCRFVDTEGETTAIVEAVCRDGQVTFRCETGLIGLQLAVGDKAVTVTEAVTEFVVAL